jgi:GNAT superfamily N-acetyltransferase
MNIEVRIPTNEDRAAWEALYRDYLEFYETAFTPEAIELTWQRILNKDIQARVAVTDGEILGFTHFHYQISTWTPTHTCYLEDLFVDEKSRSRGVARALIAAVEKESREEQLVIQLVKFWIQTEIYKIFIL